MDDLIFGASVIGCGILLLLATVLITPFFVRFATWWWNRVERIGK